MINTVLKKAFSASPKTKLAELRTWAEQLRVLAGEPVYLIGYHVPAGEYTQLSYQASELKLAEPELNDQTVNGVIHNGVVEGILTDDAFYAVNITSLDGANAYAPIETRDILIDKGFMVVESADSIKPGAIGIEQYYASCEPSGKLIFLVREDHMLSATSGNPNLPDPAIVFEFPKVEEPKEKEPSGLTVGFYGKLPRTHKEYTQLAKDKGFRVSTSTSHSKLDFLVSDADIELADTLTCELITSEEFEILINNV